MRGGRWQPPLPPTRLAPPPPALQWKEVSDRVDPSFAAPESRCFYGAAPLDSRFILVYGGADPLTGSTYGDLYLFDTERLIWLKAVASGTWPLPRYVRRGGSPAHRKRNHSLRYCRAGHALVPIRPSEGGAPRFLVFGGQLEDGTYSNEAWILSAEQL